jgi:uridine kinase
MKQNDARIVIIEHFLLLHDPRVVQELDGVLFLDPGQDNGMHLCRERRVHRNPNRSEDEQNHLRRYYERHVWPSYQEHCESSARSYCRQNPEGSRILDCSADVPLKQVLSQALSTIHEWSRKEVTVLAFDEK